MIQVMGFPKDIETPSGLPWSGLQSTFLGSDVTAAAAAVTGITNSNGPEHNKLGAISPRNC